MQLLIREMNHDAAVEILQWTYPRPYDFYNGECDEESLNEMLDGSYHIVQDEETQLIGFFCIGHSAKVPMGAVSGAYSEDLIDIGIGMKPEMTGQGFGSIFFKFILEYIENKFKKVPIRLTVATFNQRAIHLYKKSGFVPGVKFANGSVEYITMIKVC